MLIDGEVMLEDELKDFIKPEFRGKFTRENYTTNYAKMIKAHNSGAKYSIVENSIKVLVRNNAGNND